MAITTDRNDERLKNIGKDGQQEAYLVLSEEERAKGFVRPYRDTYVHQGRLHDKGIEILDEPMVHNGKSFVAIVTVIADENGKRIGGSYLTQDELDQYNRTGGYVGGCGVSTTMGQALSETYARQPDFYSGTYCAGCHKHFPVGEFVWSDGSVLGS